MNTTIQPPAFIEPSFVPVAKVPSDTVSRSKAMAVELAKRKILASNVVDAFINPAAYKGEGDRFDQAILHLSEIMNSSAGNHGPLSPIRFERHQQTLRGVAASLDWLYRETQWEHRKCFAHLTLHAMLPLYIVPASEYWESALKTTMHWLRRTACLAQLCKVLEKDGIHEWLDAEHRIQVAPQETIEKAFRICLSSVSNSYWRSMNPTFVSTPLHSNRSDEAEMEKGLWSIALQLTKRTTKLTIPPSLRVGVVSWERVLQHWETLSEQLRNGNSTTTANQETKTTTSMGGVRSCDTLHPTKSGPAKPVSALAKPERDHRLAEIRSSSDPQLSKNLDRLLQQCKKNQSVFSLVVVKRMETPNASVDEADISRWQSRFIDAMMTESEAADIRGFTTDNEELALVFVDADRAELSTWIRDSFSKISSAGKGISMTEVEPLVAGVAMVNGPSRAFAIEQLIEGAWRCLDGASIQGTHAIKTIEVY